MYKVALIGAGLQGRRRVTPILSSKNCKLTWICDRHIERAQGLATNTMARTTTDWREIANDPEVQLVLVLTPPDSHFEISSAMLNKGKHVLCEKPLTRSSQNAKELASLAKNNNLILKCGFNHRHHPAVTEAYKKIQSGEYGKPVFIRAKYGIGGRQDVKNEWRSDPKVVAGGQLMEQGIHLIDLISWMTGGIEEVSCMATTSVFPIAPLEDNAFVLLRSTNGALSSVHSTLCQWINEFEMEIYTEKGFICIQGLGASYGVEKLRHGINIPGRPFTHETIEYRGGDISWEAEWNEFISAIQNKSQPIGNGTDGANAVAAVELAYLANKQKQTLNFSQVKQ